MYFQFSADPIFPPECIIVMSWESMPYQGTHSVHGQIIVTLMYMQNTISFEEKRSIKHDCTMGGQERKESCSLVHMQSLDTLQQANIQSPIAGSVEANFGWSGHFDFVGI